MNQPKEPDDCAPLDFSELDSSFELNTDDFAGFEIDLGGDFDNRYFKPPKTKDIPYHALRFQDAEKLAVSIGPPTTEFRADCIVSGTFIFGDFIEAYIVKHSLQVAELTISTLSMSQDNVDSLAGLMAEGYVDSLNLITSDYFYSHERRALVPYIYQHLDQPCPATGDRNRFQFAAAGTHCKVALMRTTLGNTLTMHGSANLRSSNNIEQFTLEANAPIYDLHYAYQQRILERFKTVNKAPRNQTLWQLVTSQEAAAKQVPKAPASASKPKP